jgi:hypothetical protein
MNKRPRSITLIGSLFIAVGCVSQVSHVWRFISDMSRPRASVSNRDNILDVVYATASAMAAVLAGAYVLRGRAWARWLCATWLAFHVCLSMAHSISQTAAHGLFFLGVTCLLFRPPASEYFREVRAGPRVLG